MLIIKWAIYTDWETLLRPHFSWQFCMVDCTEYKTKKEMLWYYDKQQVKEFMEWYYLEYNGEKYYQCEFSTYNTDWLELLSDISELEFYDEDTIF